MASPPVPRPREPLFLERQSYRRRRLMDAARLLPVAGGAFFLLPLLWAVPEAETPARTSAGGLYVFAVWCLLILVAAAISRRLIRTDDPPSDEEQGRGQG